MSKHLCLSGGPDRQRFSYDGHTVKSQKALEAKLADMGFTLGQSRAGCELLVVPDGVTQGSDSSIKEMGPRGAAAAKAPVEFSTFVNTHVKPVAQRKLLIAWIAKQDARVRGRGEDDEEEEEEEEEEENSTSRSKSSAAQKKKDQLAYVQEQRRLAKAESKLDLLNSEEEDAETARNVAVRQSAQAKHNFDDALERKKKFLKQQQEKLRIAKAEAMEGLRRAEDEEAQWDDVVHGRGDEDDEKDKKDKKGKASASPSSPSSPSFFDKIKSNRYVRSAAVAIHDGKDAAVKGLKHAQAAVAETWDSVVGKEAPSAVKGSGDNEDKNTVAYWLFAMLPCTEHMAKDGVERAYDILTMRLYLRPCHGGPDAGSVVHEYVTKVLSVTSNRDVQQYKIHRAGMEKKTDFEGNMYLQTHVLDGDNKQIALLKMRRVELSRAEVQAGGNVVFASVGFSATSDKRHDVKIHDAASHWSTSYHMDHILFDVSTNRRLLHQHVLYELSRAEDGDHIKNAIIAQHGQQGAVFEYRDFDKGKRLIALGQVHAWNV
jgi:hypothetical protein